ncbi:MAG: hypothetical protein GXO50_09605 [Chlorobi bacterium]|nr:hypothetical protein [Chlorobiota bacterium]
MKKRKNISTGNFITVVTVLLLLTSAAFTEDYDFGNLKNKPYYNKLFNQSQKIKLAEADNLYAEGKTRMLEADKYFRKADGFKKVAENYGGKTLKKAKRYEKKGIKTSLKAYNDLFKATNIKFHVYADKLKNMNTDNSKKHLKAEEIAINARSIFIEGTEMKEKAEKLNGKAETDALKLAFEKHLEAIHNQEIAFAVYMNDPDINYNTNNNVTVNTDNNKTAPENNKTYENNNEYSPENDPNIYESKEKFITEHLNISREDLSALADAEDKKAYADKIMEDVNNDYSKIDKIRTEAETADDEYEKEMKHKMTAGLEEILTDKMLKAADLYFNADKTKYEIYEKYLPQARTSDKINQARKYEEKAQKLHAEALRKYRKANFYSGHKSNKYIQIMDAVQTELSALQEQENAFAVYFEKPVTKTNTNENKGKTNDNSPAKLTYNYAGSYQYSKYNPTPVPLKPKKGIVFKVQAGLFKNLLPLKTYGKYSPISYDTFKNNPYKRFFLGEYRSYKAAEYVLNKIKRKGLSDPFIVSFEDGVKKSATYGISKIIRDEEFEKTEAKEMSLLTGKAYENNAGNETYYGYAGDNSGIKEISEFDGLIYAVQLGSFSVPKQKSDFPGIKNLIHENNKAAHKYLVGPFSSYEEAKEESKKLNASGYEGTFVVAYNYGEKIDLQKAASISKNTSLKTDKQDDIYFAVQIAAYSHKLNDAEMQQFNDIRKKYPINVTRIDGGLFLYTVGKYATYKEAASVKKDIRSMHYDGFVIAFKNGIKISAAEASEILKNK